MANCVFSTSDFLHVIILSAAPKIPKTIKGGVNFNANKVGIKLLGSGALRIFPANKI